MKILRRINLEILKAYSGMKRFLDSHGFYSLLAVIFIILITIFADYPNILFIVALLFLLFLLISHFLSIFVGDNCNELIKDIDISINSSAEKNQISQQIKTPTKKMSNNKI